MFSQWHTVEQQSDLDFGHDLDFPPALDELPRISPFFFVPPLENKPQNPIMENLKLEKVNMNIRPMPLPPKQLPEELEALTLDFITREIKKDKLPIGDLWGNVSEPKVRQKLQ